MARRKATKDLLINPNPMPRGTRRERCSLRDSLGYRSVEAMMVGLGEFVIVVEATLGCDQPSPLLVMKVSKYNNGLTPSLSQALKWCRKDLAVKYAEAKRTKVVERYTVMTVQQACVLHYQEIGRPGMRTRYVNGKNVDRLPKMEDLVRLQASFYGSMLDSEGRIAPAYHLTVKDALVKNLKDQQASVKRGLAVMKRLEDLYARAK